MISLSLYATAPLIVRIVFGGSLHSVISILRLLSLLPALVGINLLLGNQWMIPVGLESRLNRIYLRSGILNVALACVLAPRYQGMGMAFSVLSAESFTAVASIFVLCRNRTGNSHSLTKLDHLAITVDK